MFNFEDRVVGFFYYINAREHIRIVRENGKEPPWTNDKILQEYSFCNVFREDDKVTKWVRENWREPYKDHPNMPFSMAVARQINWPPTLQEIGFPEKWEPSKVKKIMERRMNRGEKVYTGAYMLTGTLGGTKIEQTVDKILSPLHFEQPKIVSNSLEKTWRNYLSKAGFSGFMAYEVVTDLRHTKYLNEAEDIMTWANPGPGARRGLNRIHDRPLNKGVSTEKLIEEMRELLSLSKEHTAPFVKTLEMRDIEHCLCEFDKYERTRNGEGRPRAKYKYGVKEW
jgi:hypothetical protein